MTSVTIVRHGETEWNRAGKQQGLLNSDLTETGMSQARAVRDSIETNFDVLISSDLGRAVQTAEIIQEKLKLSIIFNKGIRERNLGILQGLTIPEFEAQYPDDYKQFKTRDPDYVLPEGESSRQRFSRIIAALNEIAQTYINKRIFIVGHGGVLDSLFRHTLAIPVHVPRCFSLFNGSINKFTYKNAWKLESWGETQHLFGIEALDDT
jgi:2,3-bisphosphoglycerate-dependent phosphoglycerate mutase